MAGPGSTFTGPLYVGNRPGDQGTVVLAQTAKLAHGGTLTATLQLPADAQLIDIMVDSTTAWAGTTATLSIGTSGSATAYVNAMDLKAATPRARPTFTAPQLVSMGDLNLNTAMVCTVTESAVSAGAATVTVTYMQTLTPDGFV